MSLTSFEGPNCGIQVGTNNASITANFHISHDRPEKPPSALSTVPFNCDPDFVPRELLLNQIQGRLSAASQVAVVGLGGVGKSQLVIEYAYRLRVQSPGLWVFWVHASNLGRFEQSFREIANRTKIYGRQDPKANVFQLVSDWLHEDLERKWVLILDNLDDDSFLRDPLADDQASASRRPLLAFLPRVPNGKIITTSRSKDVASRLVDDQDLILVEQMDKNEALVLFKKKLPQTNFEDVPELLELLDHMPLAIVQAAAYMKRKAPRCSVRQYINQFQRNDRTKIKFLQFEAAHCNRDWDAKNSILTTWEISFNHIRQTQPSAANRLAMMSFFDCQGIPEYLLRYRGEREAHEIIADENDHGTIRSSIYSLNDAFEKDIQILRDFLFISVSDDQSTFKMPHLVQLATRNWLKSQNELEMWKDHFILNLSEEFPSDEDGNYTKSGLLFPHARAALTQRPVARLALDRWATLLCRAALYTAEMAHHTTDAVDMAKKAIEAKELLFGPESPDTLSTMDALVRIYNSQNQLKEAETLGLQVLDICTRVLGENHDSTHSIKGNLGKIYVRQGRLGEGHDLLVSLLDTAASQPDKCDSWILDHLTTLVEILRQQNRLEDAEKLARSTFEAKIRIFGMESAGTLLAMDTLVGIQVARGRLEDAEGLQEKALDVCRLHLGMDHPLTVRALKVLAMIYADQKRWRESESLWRQVIEIQGRLSGLEHPMTLKSMSSLAAFYAMQKRLQEAENLGMQVLKTQARVLGNTHSDTLDSMQILAAIYQDQGDFAMHAILMQSMINADPKRWPVEI